MRTLKLAVSMALAVASLGLLIWSFISGVSAGPSTSRPSFEDDPDLPPGQHKLDKETYLALRNQWTMLRRGVDSARPTDPRARDRAIEEMGRQLRQLEMARINRGVDSAEVSTTAWSPVGPAPI